MRTNQGEGGAPSGGAGAWPGWLAPHRATSPWQRMPRVFPFEPEDAADASLADRELIGVLRDTEALIAQATGRQARALRELRRRRLAAQAQACPQHDPQCGRECCDADGWVAPELVVELGWGERQTATRVDTALALQRHPAVEAVFDTGRVAAWTLIRFVEHLQTLSQYVTPAQLAQTEAATVAWLLGGTRTLAQLNARMRRLILRARAAARRDGDGDAPERQHADRRVAVSPSSTPGLAEVWALLPEADALAIKAALHALGHDKAGPDDDRTADQRRADLLVTLITGSPAMLGRPEDVACALRDPLRVQVRLDVTVPVDALAGGDAPAWVPGYGEVVADTARSLATGCAARPLVYDPATGRLLGFAAAPVRMTWLADARPGRGYQHPPSLDMAVRLRDCTCRAPGCARPASRCDCDHVVPYPAGPTSLGNSCCLCRRHHRLKTHAPGWQLGITPEGEATWTTPAGTQACTSPHDYRVADPDPPSDPDPPPF